MKKVLLFSAPFRYYQGGSEYQYQLLEQQLKSRYQLYFLFRRPGDRQESKWIEDGVHFVTYETRRQKGYNPYQYREIPNLLSHISAIKPDIIYKRGLNYITAAGVYYAKKQRIKSICHISSEADVTPYRLVIDKRAAFDWFNKKLNRYSLKNADHVVTQAAYQDTLLAKNFGRQSDAIIPNFHPIPPGPFDKPDNKTVVWIANFKRMKHPEVFIQLAEAALGTIDAEFIMIGRPAKGQWQKQLQKRIDLLPNLSHIGEQPIEAVAEVLAKAHLFVNTSDFEGLPNTFIQSWMREVPVVSLNVDPDDMIRQHVIGRLSGSFSQLVKDCREVLQNQILRETMGKKARKLAEEKYSLRNVQNLIDIFDA